MKYIKWKEEVIACINSDYSVDFMTDITGSYIGMDEKAVHWTRDQFARFLEDRIVSRQRRDIEKILFRCGLTGYDPFKIAACTKAINAKDLLWIADHENDSFEEAITDVFESIFVKKVDMVGDSINTPEGCNVKRYGVYDGKYGIYKNRLHPLSTDVESEVAVYKLAKRLGIPCCKVIQTDENTVFSEFQYDFGAEQIIHFRMLFEDGEQRSENELTNLLGKKPQFKHEFYQMMLLDYLTLQDDRHLSNFAVKRNLLTGKESFYPLYDNGRSLFYQDNNKTIEKAWQDPKLFCTTFGAEGSYYDHVTDILTRERESLSLIDLSITDGEIYDIMASSGFCGHKLEGIIKWIDAAIRSMRELANC